MHRVLACSVAVGTLVSGCGTGQGPLQSSAGQDVRERAVTAGLAMAKASRGSSAFEHARVVVASGTGGGEGIALMDAAGTGVDGYVVLRITSVYDDDGPWDNDSTATACYRYQFGSRDRGTTPVEVPCPETAPLTLPPPPFEARLPVDAANRLTRLLQLAAAPASVAVAFPEPGLTIDTFQDDAAVGVAVGASAGECLMGRRLSDGSVEVWHVPPILAMPGELGCDARAASTGDAQSSPH